MQCVMQFQMRYIGLRTDEEAAGGPRYPSFLCVMDEIAGSDEIGEVSLLALEAFQRKVFRDVTDFIVPRFR
jgi:hypothetical protein